MNKGQHCEALLELERMGIFPKDVIAVCRYKPSTDKPRRYYYKQIIEVDDGGKRMLIHKHIRVKDVPIMLAKWERTLKYRQYKRECRQMLNRNRERGKYLGLSCTICDFDEK